MNNFKFKQVLNVQDQVEFNMFLLKQKLKSMILTPILGLFLIGISIYMFCNPEGDITTKILLCILGVFLAFVSTPLLYLIEKNIIKKQIKEDRDPINVIVNEEGIIFEAYDEEDDEFIETQTINNNTHEDIEYEINSIEESHNEIVESENDQTQAVERERFSIPWGGINKIIDKDNLLYIMIPGYSAMPVKKISCKNYDELINYIKIQLGNDNRYIEINKK